MNARMIVVAILALGFIILALVYLLPGDNETLPGQSSPYAIDQSQ